MKYDKYIVRVWEHKGEIREAPYKREIVPLLGPERRGVKEMNVNITFIDPYSGTQYHAHVISELIYVISGRGEVLIENEKYEIIPDTVFYLPKDVFHQLKNTGPETLKLLNVFAPGMNREMQKSKIVVNSPPDEADIVTPQ